MKKEILEQKLSLVKDRIEKAARQCGRNPADIQLVAVSKSQTPEMIRAAYEAGQKSFGENYVQELVEKAETLGELDTHWHFIGHLQRNKVKYIAPFVTCIHSLDSIRLAEEIEKRASHTTPCLIEVNIGGEASKSGLPPDQINALLSALAPMKKVDVIGLMTVPPLNRDPEKSRPSFRQLKFLIDDINKKEVYPRKLTELSMGMTGDFEIAIEEGATIVRVGTAIFGERK